MPQGATEVQTPSHTDDERRTIDELARQSDRDDAERDGKRASLFMAGVSRAAEEKKIGALVNKR